MIESGPRQIFRFVRGCTGNIEFMGGLTRRRLLVSSVAALPLAASTKGTGFPTETQRYADPLTELDVYRLTDPAHTSRLPAHYNRAISRNSAWLLYACDRDGSLQAYRLDLKNGQEKLLTQAQDLDAASLTLTPDNRSFCYFAGRTLCVTGVSSLTERKLYTVPDGWERSAGMSVGPDGTHVTFVEHNENGSRLRMVSLAQGAARTAFESKTAMADPIPRPMRAQVLYRVGDQSLFLVNMDGQQNREFKTAEGRVGPANWAPDGKTVLYLNFPADAKQLNNLRELTPDSNSDKMLAKTSQFVHFGFNHDASVFAGASRNLSSPALLLLLRVTKREFTLCEHKASSAEMVAPIFSPDSQRVYFQSDRHGKPAIYSMHVEKLVEKTDTEG
jgi:oligogalacturonide lyase